MASESSVGFVTGGASGMGLHVVEDLVAKGWKMAVFDFDQVAGSKVAARLGDQVLFIKGNVVSYEEQAAAFSQTWKKWGRIDFVYANAGIGDRIDFYKPMDELSDEGPPKPNSLVLDICLNGVVWTSYLALHFFRKNATKGGKLVMTSSSAGLYPSGSIPLYAAAKNGVVGLTRAMGQRLAQLKEPITVNCVCPGLVPTALMPPAWANAVPTELHTPTATIVKAINEFLQDSSITGQAAECSGTEVIYRPPFEPINDAAKFLIGGTWVKDVDLKGMMQHAQERSQYYDTIEAAMV